MNRLIYYGSVEAIPFYNCSRKSSAEWTATGTRRPWLGVPLVFFGVFIEMLYVPIIYIIFKKKLIRHACYKIIVLLAIIDMAATCCCSLITGSLLTMGTVFCSYPTFTYIAGSAVICLWCSACATTVSLFINRIVSIACREYAVLVENKMLYITTLLVVFYGFYMFFFTPNLCFNSTFMAWIPDPLSEEKPSKEAADMYKNTVQAWNNWLVDIVIFILFTVYSVMVKKIARGQMSKASLSIFIQCSIICFFNTVGALIYNALLFVTPADWIMVIAQWSWSINHACPALIYVTLNETIKREFRRLILGATSQKIDSIHVSSVVTSNRSRI